VEVPDWESTSLSERGAQFGCPHFALTIWLMNWYFLNEENEVVGPVSEDDLKGMLDSGSLSVESQVCREGTEKWGGINEMLGGFPQPEDRSSVNGEAGGRKVSKQKRKISALMGAVGLLLVLGAVIFFASAWTDSSPNLDNQTVLAAQLSKEGIPEDPKQAFNLYLEAAVQGDAEAQNVLALMYSTGQGVVENDDEARKWWGIAAEQGHPFAQYKQGARLQWASAGVGASGGTEAYMWYDLAASGSDRKVARAAKIHRDELEGTLSPAEIKEAEQMSREWRPKPFAEQWASAEGQTSTGAVGLQSSPTQSLNSDLEAAIRAIAAVYPELSREEHIRKLEEISGLRMISPSNARQARVMVNQMRGAAKISGQSEREFSDWSEQKRKELEKDINGILSRPE